jgi:hypothetical protein
LNRVLIPDAGNLFAFTPHQCQLDRKGLRFSLPDSCEDGNRRRLKRHPVNNLKATVDIGSREWKGRLILDAFDLSGEGFAVHEPLNGSPLTPGLCIHDLKLHFQDCPSIRCEAQVVYRYRDTTAGGGSSKVRCGLVITDISPEAHTRLLARLTHTCGEQTRTRTRTHICKPLDMDALWHFFFETDFIYPEKYAGLRDRIEEIKATHKRLYLDPSKISRHFIHQEDGTLLGHVAGIRAYENSWLIHHLAADTAASPAAALAVCRQVGHFLMTTGGPDSSHMQYILNYYQTDEDQDDMYQADSYQADKKSSERFWGGVTRYIDDPQRCCQYRFTYLRIRKMAHPQRIPQESYTISPCRRQDLRALQQAFQSAYGDLLLAALDLVPERLNANTLSDEYQRMRLHRQRRLFAIKKGRQLEAVCMVLQTEEGLDLSGLINNIQVMVLPGSDIPAAALQQILQKLAEPFDQEKVTVMLFPHQYAQEQCLMAERQYTLWVLDTRSSEAYCSYIDRSMRFIRDPAKEDLPN